MMHRFKCLWGSLWIVVLSLYCRGALALQAAMNTGGAVSAAPGSQSTVAPAPATPPAHPSVPAFPSLQAGEFTQKQVMVGSMAAFGRLFILIAFFWLLIDVMRKLGGGKPAFKKPLILGGAGILMAYIIPVLIK